MLKAQTKKIKNRKVSKIIAGILSLLMFATSNGSFLVWGLSEGQLNFLGEPAVAQAKVIETAEAITVDEIVQESQPKKHWWEFWKKEKTENQQTVGGFSDLKTELVARELLGDKTVDALSDDLKATKNNSNKNLEENNKKVDDIDKYIEYIDLTNKQPGKKIGFFKKLWANAIGLFSKDLKTSILEGIDISNNPEAQNANKQVQHDMFEPSVKNQLKSEYNHDGIKFLGDDGESVREGIRVQVVKRIASGDEDFSPSEVIIRDKDDIQSEVNSLANIAKTKGKYPGVQPLQELEQLYFDAYREDLSFYPTYIPSDDPVEDRQRKLIDKKVKEALDLQKAYNQQRAQEVAKAVRDDQIDRFKQTIEEKKKKGVDVRVAEKLYQKVSKNSDLGIDASRMQIKTSNLDVVNDLLNSSQQSAKLKTIEEKNGWLAKVGSVINPLSWFGGEKKSDERVDALDSFYTAGDENGGNETSDTAYNKAVAKYGKDDMKSGFTDKELADLDKQMKEVGDNSFVTDVNGDKILGVANNDSGFWDSLIKDANTFYRKTTESPIGRILTNYVPGIRDVKQVTDGLSAVSTVYSQHTSKTKPKPTIIVKAKSITEAMKVLFPIDSKITQQGSGVSIVRDSKGNPIGSIRKDVNGYKVVKFSDKNSSNASVNQGDGERKILSTGFKTIEDARMTLEKRHPVLKNSIKYVNSSDGTTVYYDKNHKPILSIKKDISGNVVIKDFNQDNKNKKGNTNNQNSLLNILGMLPVVGEPLKTVSNFLGMAQKAPETADRISKGDVKPKDAETILSLVALGGGGTVTAPVLLGVEAWKVWQSYSPEEKKAIATKAKTTVDALNKSISVYADKVSKFVGEVGNDTIAIMPSGEAGKFTYLGDGKYFYSTNPKDIKIYERTESGQFIPVILPDNQKKKLISNAEIIKSAKEDAWGDSGPSQYFVNSSDSNLYTEVYQSEHKKFQNVNDELEKAMNQDSDLFEFGDGMSQKEGGGQQVVSRNIESGNIPELKDDLKTRPLPVDWKNNPDNFINDKTGQLTEEAKKEGYVLRNNQVIKISADKYYELDDRGGIKECFFNTTLLGCTKGSEFREVLEQGDNKTRHDSISQVDQTPSQTQITDKNGDEKNINVDEVEEYDKNLSYNWPDDSKPGGAIKAGSKSYVNVKNNKDHTRNNEGQDYDDLNRDGSAWYRPTTWFNNWGGFFSGNNGDNRENNRNNYVENDQADGDLPKYLLNNGVGNDNNIVDGGSNEYNNGNNNQQTTGDGDVNKDMISGLVNDSSVLPVGQIDSDVLQSAENDGNVNNPVNAPSAGNDFGFNQFVKEGLLPGLATGGQRGILAIASGADNDEVLGIIAQDVIGSSMNGAVDAVFGEDRNGDGVKEAGWLAHSMGNVAAGVITALTVGDKGDAVEAASNLVFEAGVNALGNSGVIKPEDVDTIKGATTSYLGQGMIDMAKDLTNGIDFDQALEHGLTTAAVGYINKVVIPNNAKLWGGNNSDTGLTGAGLTTGVSSLGRQLLNGEVDVKEFGEDVVQGVATQYAINAIGHMAASTAIDSLAPNVGVDIAQEVGSKATAEAIGSYSWMARAAITVGRMLIDGEIDATGVATTALSIGATVVANMAIYGAASGIATGAAAGSVVPGIGTAIGAVVGLVAGMLMGGSGPHDYEVADWKASAGEAINPSLIVKGLNPAVSQAITQVAQSGDVDKAKQMMRQALENTALGRLAMMSGLNGLLDSAVALMDNRITRLRNDFGPGELEGYTGDNIHTGDTSLDEATNKYMHLKNKLKDCYLRKDQDCVGDVSQKIRDVRNGLIALATAKFNNEIAKLNKEIHDLENRLAKAKTAKERAEYEARLREARQRRDILRNARDQYNEVARSCSPGLEWHFVDHRCIPISDNKAHCEHGGGTWHGSLVTGTTGCICDKKPGGHWMGDHCEYGFNEKQQEGLRRRDAADECSHRIGNWRWDGQNCIEISSKEAEKRRCEARGGLLNSYHWDGRRCIINSRN